MAGFLTGVFDDGGSQSAGNDQQVAGGDSFDADPSLTVSDSEEFGFEDMNGTEHSYSNSQEVTVNTDTHAMLGVAADLSQGAFTGDGFEE